VQDESLEAIELDDSQLLASSFLDAVNRGGLCKPAEFTFTMALLCYRVFEEIRHNVVLHDRFLRMSNHRSLFCKIIERACYVGTSEHEPIEANVCVNGHDLNKLVAQRMFNCFAKNLVKSLTNKANSASTHLSQKRKIAKLQSVKK